MIIAIGRASVDRPTPLRRRAPDLAVGTSPQIEFRRCQVKAGMMPVAGQNAVPDRAAVKRKTEATVIALQMLP